MIIRKYEECFPFLFLTLFFLSFVFFLTGSVATKKIRELGFKGLIIGLSGDDRCMEFKENGADKFLMKPVNRKQLSEALRSESISQIRKSHTV
jgi:FixJ family two-component response regulator